MIGNPVVKIKSPIKVISSNLYYLIVEDANGTRHYWNKAHNSIHGDIKEGTYDGWSKQLEKHMLKV